MEEMEVKELSNLHNFAFCGKQEGYENAISYLANFAEKELWGFDDNKSNHILKKYISGTFKQCYNQQKIIYTEDKCHCCFNTGLLTQNGDDILGFFAQNTRKKCTTLGF